MLQFRSLHMVKSLIFLFEIALLVLLGFIYSETYLLKSAMAESRAAQLNVHESAQAEPPSQESAATELDAYLPPVTPAPPAPSADEPLPPATDETTSPSEL